MQIAAASIQMRTVLGRLGRNLERADALLYQARNGGAELAVLPEMFNTGYGLVPDYEPFAEGRDGPTLTHLSRRSRAWSMTIVAGFVERDGHHLYDALAVCLPAGGVQVYRKRNLVFWERFRFCPGRVPLVVEAPWGRVGFAICADMIYSRTWDDYRGRIDLAIVSAAWPEFARRETGRPHWLLGHIGPLAKTIPPRAAADLGVPVVFANQCGPTQTTIPVFGVRMAESLADRFVGSSSICGGDGTTLARLDRNEEVIVAPIEVPQSQGMVTCRTTFPLGSAA